MFTIAERGTGQALMQRSQPIHISISKRTSFSVSGTRSARCCTPTTRSGFEGDVCILISSLLCHMACCMLCRNNQADYWLHYRSGIHWLFGYSCVVQCESLLNHMGALRGR